MTDLETPEGPEIKAPVQGRPEFTLATCYGFGFLVHSTERLAASIPESGRVADIGAGLSTLGEAVCELRPDVSWLNIDPAYSVPWIRDRALAGAPPNLECRDADILDLPEDIEPGTFDRVFSYFLLPHINRVSREAGLQASRNMLSLLAQDGGELRAGPRSGLHRLYGRLNTIRIKAPGDDAGLETQAGRLARATDLSTLWRLWWEVCDIDYTPPEELVKVSERQPLPRMPLG